MNWLGVSFGSSDELQDALADLLIGDPIGLCNIAISLGRNQRIQAEHPDVNAGIFRFGRQHRSVIELNPDALDIAGALDKERLDSGARGPLHGIPVLLKANIDTGDKMSTTAGLLAMAGHRPPDDAFLVARLREAGAVILGKANLSEWANFRSQNSSSGWSSIGGQTRNP